LPPSSPCRAHPRPPAAILPTLATLLPNPAPTPCQVDDFGFDGVDIDYEPSSPACTATGGRVSCASDAEFVRVTANLRKALPTGAYLLSLAGFSVGAYGEGSYASAKPVSEHTGVSLAVARTAAGQALDLINIMA
jgi:chitinase